MTYDHTLDVNGISAAAQRDPVRTLPENALLQYGKGKVVI
jgi:hypothetical protein